MENAILGALFNDFVPKLTVETHILREFRSYLMKNVYLCFIGLQSVIVKLHYKNA